MFPSPIFPPNAFPASVFSRAPTGVGPDVPGDASVFPAQVFPSQVFPAQVFGQTGGAILTDFNSVQAVQDWWEGQSALQALVTKGKLWHKSAPENASVEPYATFFLVSEVPVTFTTAYTYWESTFQVNIHHYLPQLAVALAKQFADALNSLKPGGVASVTPGSPQIQIFGTNAIHALPGSFAVDEGEGLGANGRDCWICHFEVIIPWTN